MKEMAPSFDIGKFAIDAPRAHQAIDGRLKEIVTSVAADIIEGIGPNRQHDKFIEVNGIASVALGLLQSTSKRHP
jgi:hypothetical protein